MENMIDPKNIERLELNFSKEELKELEKARSMAITFDKDCPETTPERAVRFRRVNPPRGSLLRRGSKITDETRKEECY